MGLTRPLEPAATGRAPAPAPAGRRAGTDDALGLLMLAFDGFELPADMADRLASAPAAGITLFRFLNVASPGQVRGLTGAIQAAAARRQPDAPPRLIAADQEGGQFLALGEESTPFAGNMALGAAGDPDLAERVGRAIGRELRAMGVNVSYTPVCDVATDPANPGIGIRAFGDDPVAVGALAAATVRGLRAGGVATTAKHFPGTGDVAVDPHLELPVLAVSAERLRSLEFVPFRAAVAAGADLVMSGHVALPAITGDPTLPATLSRAVMHDLLRDELGFDGLAISDALDMRALPQGPEQALDVIASLRAGLDLLLLSPDPGARYRIETAVAHAASRGLLERSAVARSLARLARLQAHLADVPAPGLDVIGSAEHQRLAKELAERSVTLVRNDEGLLPIRSGLGARIAAIMPQPRDLTPADTSSRVPPMLAAALRAHHPVVDEFVTSNPPTAVEISALRDQVRAYDLVVIGTIAASFDRNQADLVEVVLATGVPTLTVALRTPFDLASYPMSRTHVCTYGILRPSLDALAGALFGRTPFRGRLPAAIPGLYPTGHGITA
jgi:beta-N-acetylhexosaminidase